MAGAGRTNERAMSHAVLRILSDMPNRTATISEIIEKIPLYVDLTPQDRAQSQTRPGEQLWEQVVRNIASHRASDGNFVHEGYIEIVEHGVWKITKLGFSKI